jgi:uncharacterized membrane protein
MLAKWERLPLKAVVFTLAMLSPMTVMAVAFALRPEIPAYNDAIMSCSLRVFSVVNTRYSVAAGAAA